MTKGTFLLINLALAFYNVGTIWAHEVDIFRTWKLLDPKTFAAVQGVHWKKLPYWVFIPVGLSLIGAVALFWYHPDKISSLGDLACFWIPISFTCTYGSFLGTVAS